MQDNFQYIVEAQVCLSKEFKLVECNSKLSSFMKQPEQPCIKLLDNILENLDNYLCYLF